MVGRSSSEEKQIDQFVDCGHLRGVRVQHLLARCVDRESLSALRPGELESLLVGLLADRETLVKLPELHRLGTALRSGRFAEDIFDPHARCNEKETFSLRPGQMCPGKTAVVGD